jgi:hypothetical protein
MDGLSFHPYPNAATDPLSRGYAWPNAGFVNLDRLKQAVWDAFAGTAQPTTVDGLRLYLDEVGWQVDTTGRDGYVGTENVPVTKEENQAAIYGELVRRAACVQDIAQVTVFGFRDDALRTGFQAGLYRTDGSARPAAGEVAAAVAGGVCVGSSAWRPLRSVQGARRPVARVSARAVAVELTATEAVSARVCVLRGARTLPSALRVLAGRTVGASACATTAVAQNRRSRVLLARPAGSLTLAVRFVAETNPARTTTEVRRLR